MPQQGIFFYVARNGIVKRVYAVMYAITCLAGVLSGCGGGDSSETGEDVSLKSFMVSGGDLTSGKIPIDANINNGSFRVDWEITGSGFYRAELYVSADANLNKTDDIRFFSQNCQDGFILVKCGTTGGFDCQFTTENKISCGAENSSVDLSAFLKELPQSAYIILNIQDSGDISRGESDTMEVPVIFR